MPIDYHYITAFLQRMENAPPSFAPSCKGYVPMRHGIPIGASGVTIGTGIDLGQQTAKKLMDMGVSSSLIGSLIPYLGLKKMAAVNKLKALPLLLSSETVQNLDMAVISSYTRATAMRFTRMAEHASSSAEHSSPLAEHSSPFSEHASSSAEHASPLAEHASPLAEHASSLAEHSSPFSERPKQIQAVAVSLEYQLGAGGAEKFTMPLAQGNYAQAIQRLRSQQNYTHRRNKEASLIAEVL